MAIRNRFRRETFLGTVKRLGALRLRMSHSSLLLLVTLLLILFIAFLVRLLPIRWGYYMSEFDPHFQYRVTKDMVDNGFFHWLSWRDTMRWYPYGYNTGKAYPGLPITAAVSFLTLNALGLAPAPLYTSHPLTVDPVFNFCIIFPVLMGTITCFVVYFVGKDVGGKAVGIFSALFLALNASYIGRTSLGFFDNETVGVFGLLLFIFFFLRSIEPQRSLRNSFLYALSAGLSLGYLLASWGAARYPLGMTAIFVVLLLLMRRYSSRLFFSYSATFGIALFMATFIPQLGGVQFLTESYVLPLLGIFLLLCIIQGTHYIQTSRMKTLFVVGSLGAFIVLFLLLLVFGGIAPTAYKWIAVMNPFARVEATGSSAQLVISVQEQRPAAWGSFYYDLGVGALFVPLGLYFAIQNPTNRNIFFCIFGLTAVYFASSMVRLTILMAPAFSVLWALALVKLLRPFVTILREGPAAIRRKRYLKGFVGKEFSIAFIGMTFLLLSLTFVLPSALASFPRVISHAYSPTTIAAGSMPVKPVGTVPDWIDTLNWMRVNLPPSPPSGDTIVASWWDYGYWITIIANRTTLADNATKNSTQIGNIGEMFLSNETRALEILQQYNATHVVVFTTFQSDGSDVGWGDEGKWRWMARIGGLDESTYGNVTEGQWIWNEKGQSTVLYKLMRYGNEVIRQGISTITLDHFEPAYFSQTPGSPRSYGGAIPLVCVYTVNYD